MEKSLFNHKKYGFALCSIISIKEMMNEKIYSSFLTCNFDNQIVRDLNTAAQQNSYMVIVSAFLHPGKDFFSEKPLYLNNLIEPFAQKNYYREIIRNLKQMTSDYRNSLNLRKRDVRFFSNSRLPEKISAAYAGLGFPGRNSLLINPNFGSNFLLGGAILPYSPQLAAASQQPQSPENLCGSCRICSETCPAEALSPAGNDFTKCYQFKAPRQNFYTIEEMLKRPQSIYGCSLCQDSCPFNIKRSQPDVFFETAGSGIPQTDVLELLKAGDNIGIELKKLLKDSAMSMNWISEEALAGNLLISAFKIAADKTDSYYEQILKNIFKFSHSSNALFSHTAKELQFYYKNINKTN
jgi:epoxyqueuosine reductase QueG